MCNTGAEIAQWPWAQMAPSERVLACELLSLYSAEALQDAASAAGASFAADLATESCSADAASPTLTLTDTDSEPAETLLRLASATVGLGFGAGSAGDAVSEDINSQGGGAGAAAGQTQGPEVRAAALARVTPEVYTMLAEGLRTRLILVRSALSRAQRTVMCLGSHGLQGLVLIT